MARSTEEDINEFLSTIQEVAKSSFTLVQRKENKETLLCLGFNDKVVKEVINQLTIEDYCEGPSQDPKYNLQSWIFGKAINNREVYIKLQKSHFNDPGDEIETLYCISFHFSKEPLNYPYKNKR
ncbi:MAG: hypothetical protein ABFD58_08755 [Anaerolineaceae bacterium]